MTPQLSIIGGRFKGMKLHSPPAGITRPLRAIVKKSLFDSLGERIVGAGWLDLYAGSGSIGLEAISRGVSRCIFVESAPDVFKTLRKNMDKISRAVDNDAVLTRLIMDKVEDFLAGPVPTEAPFDFLFIDPPFADRAAVKKCLDLLEKNRGWVAGGSVVISHTRGDPDVGTGAWREFDRRVFGDSLILRFERRETGKNQ